MKTSTVAWSLTALIVVVGIAWYLYANSSQGAYTAPATNTPVVTNPGPDYTPASTSPVAATSTKPVASSTTSVTSSTTLNVH